MKMLTEIALLDLLREAYRLGFSASGEGYNAEYPFQDYGDAPEENEEWIGEREEKLIPLIHADAGGYDGKGKKV